MFMILDVTAFSLMYTVHVALIINAFYLELIPSKKSGSFNVLVTYLHPEYISIL